MKLILLFFSGTFKVVGTLLKYWPLVTVAAFFILPFGPHIRWEYEYLGSYSDKIYVRCDYIGSRGLIQNVPYAPPSCPFIMMLDSREYAQ